MIATHKRSGWLLVLLTLLLTLARPQPLSAAEVTTTASFGPVLTNWESTLTIDQFDPALGQLTKVEVTLRGAIDGDAKFESTDPNPTMVTLNLSADIELKRPNNNSFLKVAPLAKRTVQAGPFDGVVDFGGTSGATLINLTDSKSDTTVLTAAADLALFTGPGQITLPVRARGTSSDNGSGNLITEYRVAAEASVRVVYTYDTAREPGPGINLNKTVYAGHDDGARCPGRNLVIGALGDAITYCFTITNDGDTPLIDLTLVDAQLGLDLSDLMLVRGNPNIPLAPGEQLVYAYETTLQSDLDNTATAEGQPTDDNGTPIPDEGRVRDRDSARVRIRIESSVTVCKEDSQGNRLPDWMIELYGPDDQSGVTGSEGCITFSVELSGDYTIREVLQEGWRQLTPPNTGAFTTTLQNGDAAGPFVFVNQQEALIRGCKVNDVTNQPLPGWTITLSGPETQSAITGADGCVRFSIIQPGDYTLTEVLQPGWRQVVPPPPGHFTITGVSPGQRYGDTGEYTFRNHPTTGITIIKEAAPADGTDFSFTGTLGPFTLDDSALDDGDPFTTTRQFIGLTIGVYTITETPVAGWQLKNVRCTGEQIQNSVWDGQSTLRIGLEPGEAIACIFTNERLARLSLIKKVINDDGGSAGPNEFGLRIGDQPVVSGEILGVLPGRPYTLTEAGLAGYTFVSLTGDPQCPTALGGQVIPAPGDNILCIITNDDDSDDGDGGGPPRTGTIGDFVWRDSNGDGIQNDGPNSGLPGVVVRLYHSNGQFTGRTAVTDGQGRYLFGDLTPGTYVVEFTPPTGYAFTRPNATGDASDSDAIPDAATGIGRTALITVGPDERNDTVDAGFIPVPKLVIAKSVSAEPAQPGGILTYTIVFTNVGQLAATGVVVTETVPNFTTFLPTQSTPGWRCANGQTSAGTPCTFAIGTLPAQGGNGRLFFVVQIDKALRVPADGLIIFNSVLIGEKDRTTPPTRTDEPKRIPPSTPTGETAAPEPAKASSTLFLPVITSEKRRN
jgi:uncharacterized repeat protein (TIGR01451 family)